MEWRGCHQITIDWHWTLMRLEKLCRVSMQEKQLDLMVSWGCWPVSRCLHHQLHSVPNLWCHLDHQHFISSAPSPYVPMSIMSVYLPCQKNWKIRPITMWKLTVDLPITSFLTGVKKLKRLWWMSRTDPRPMRNIPDWIFHAHACIHRHVPGHNLMPTNVNNT